MMNQSEKLLASLDEQQQAAASAPLGPVCILAGAGTGKTRTITYRMAYQAAIGALNPQRTLAVTFTTRAAEELRSRLAELGIGGVQARTFHAAARRQVQYFWNEIAPGVQWRLLSNRFPLVATALRRQGVSTSTEMVRDVLAEIAWAKATLVTPEQYAQAAAQQLRELPLDAAKLAAVYNSYEQLRLTPEGMLLDFDDLLLNVAAALETREDIAFQFRQQYRSFIVDEYQDVTPLQQRVLAAWLGGRDDLTVVGDANQTIYSFTGATPRYLLDFSRTYPGAHLTRLERDYRSTPQITELANSVISQASGRIAGTKLELKGMRPAGPQPRFEEFADEATEVAAVVRRIGELIAAGVPANEIAVLYRVNAQSAAYEAALDEAEIAYRVHGGTGFFQRPEIRAALTELARWAGNPAAQSHALQITGAVVGEQLPQLVRVVLARLGLEEKEPEGAKARERWQALQALVNLSSDLVRQRPQLELAGLLQELRRRAENQHEPTLPAVTLASLHAAKGLEWDAVFIVGLVEGSLPIRQAIKAGPEQIEEERRLFYVGITRAREHLMCSWALARAAGGRARPRTRFIDGIVPEAATQATPARRRQTRCRVCHLPLESAVAKVLGHHEDCDGGGDAHLVEALRNWRIEMATTAGKPAYLIFNDATLLAIAEARPTTPAQLLQVPGIGPVKLEEFGVELLQLIADN